HTESTPFKSSPHWNPTSSIHHEGRSITSSVTPLMPPHHGNTVPPYDTPPTKITAPPPISTFRLLFFVSSIDFNGRPVYGKSVYTCLLDIFLHDFFLFRISLCEK
ncbi:hypothetical protein LSH36_58g14048, partial [Paralvinella palmiformis]